MVWEKRYFAGGVEGWQNIKTKDIIYAVYRHDYEVILNGKRIKTYKSFEEADAFIEEYIRGN